MQLHMAVAAPDRLCRVARGGARLAIAQQAGIGRHALPTRAAQQCMQRLARDAPRDVPQRDVDRREPERHRPVAAEIVKTPRQLRRQTGDVARILSHAERREQAVHRILRGRHQVEAKPFAPAMQAGIGLDLDHQRVHGPAKMQVAADAAFSRAIGEYHTHMLMRMMLYDWQF